MSMCSKIFGRVIERRSIQQIGWKEDPKECKGLNLIWFRLMIPTSNYSNTSLKLR
jgi:hypothetical protein